MRRIPKKPGNVKPTKKARYTQKTDTAGRRYTIDSKTGKRVKNELGDKEKARLKKARAAAKKKPVKPAKIRKPATKNAAPKPPKKPRKPKTQYSTEYQSPAELKRRVAEQAERIRAQQATIEAQIKREQFLAEQAALEEQLLNEERARFQAERRTIHQQAEEFIAVGRLQGFGESIKERAAKYPRIQRALDEANNFARVESDAVRQAEKKGRPPTREEYVRARFLYALDNDEDIETVVGELADTFDYEVHDVYEIYFSPDVA